MLMDIDKHGINGEVDPRMDFVEYRATLPESEQNALNNYIIEVKCIRSRSRAAANEALLAFGQKNGPDQINRLAFSQALLGGSAATPCVKTLQVYLWKFVIDFKPEAAAKIPMKVREIAARDGYQLDPTPTRAPRAPSAPGSTSSMMLQLLASSPASKKTGAQKASGLKTLSEEDEEENESTSLHKITEEDEDSGLDSAAEEDEDSALDTIAEDDESTTFGLN